MHPSFTRVMKSQSILRQVKSHTFCTFNREVRVTNQKLWAEDLALRECRALRRPAFQRWPRLQSTDFRSVSAVKATWEKHVESWTKRSTAQVWARHLHNIAFWQTLESHFEAYKYRGCTLDTVRSVSQRALDTTWLSPWWPWLSPWWPLMAIILTSLLSCLVYFDGGTGRLPRSLLRPAHAFSLDAPQQCPKGSCRSLFSQLSTSSYHMLPLSPS